MILSWAAHLLPIASYSFQRANQPSPQCHSHCQHYEHFHKAPCVASSHSPDLSTDTSAHLHREDLPQGKEEGMHVDVWVLAETVGFGMVLEVHVVPPTGRGPLQKSRHKFESLVSPQTPGSPSLSEFQRAPPYPMDL